MKSTDPATDSSTESIDDLAKGQANARPDADQPVTQRSHTEQGTPKEGQSHATESDIPVDPANRQDLDPDPPPPPGGVPDAMPPDASPSRPERSHET